MKVIVNKQDNTRILLLATTDDDKKTLYLLYHHQVIFGLWKIWIRDGNKGLERPEIKALVSAIPELQGVGWLSLTKGFIGYENLKELHKEEKSSLFKEIE